jgi:TraM recognition site of TraD and TraG
VIDIPLFADLAGRGALAAGSVASSLWMADRGAPWMRASVAAATRGRGARELLHLHQTVPVAARRLRQSACASTDPAWWGIRPHQVIEGYVDGHVVQAGRDRSMIVWGPSGEGKSCLLTANVQAWLLARGTVVCGSEAPDVLDACLGVASTTGTVYGWDPTSSMRARPRKGVTPLPWRLMRGCTDEARALDRGRNLMAKAGQGTTDAAYFCSSAGLIMGCLLHAGELEGASWETVYGWAVDFISTRDAAHPENDHVGGGEIALGILRERARQTMQKILAGFVHKDKRNLSPIIGSLTAALDWSANPLIRAAADGGRGGEDDLRDALSRPGNLIAFVCPAGQGLSDAGALVTAFLGDVALTLRELAAEAANDRVPVPVLRALDEVTHYPVPDLPVYYATDRKRGISTIACAQDYEQMAAAWSPAVAQQFKTIGQVRMILRGCGHEGLLQWASSQTGHHHTPLVARNTTWQRHVKATGSAKEAKDRTKQDGEKGEKVDADASITYGRRWHKTGRTETTTPTREPRMTEADISNMDRWCAWVKDGGEPAGTVSLPQHWQMKPYSLWTAMEAPAGAVEPEQAWDDGGVLELPGEEDLDEAPAAAADVLEFPQEMVG